MQLCPSSVFHVALILFRNIFCVIAVNAACSLRKRHSAVSLHLHMTKQNGAVQWMFPLAQMVGGASYSSWLLASCPAVLPCVSDCTLWRKPERTGTWVRPLPGSYTECWCGPWCKARGQRGCGNHRTLSMTEEQHAVIPTFCGFSFHGNMFWRSVCSWLTSYGSVERLHLIVVLSVLLYWISQLEGDKHHRTLHLKQTMTKTLFTLQHLHPSHQHIWSVCSLIHFLVDWL